MVLNDKLQYYLCIFYTFMTYLAFSFLDISRLFSLSSFFQTVTNFQNIFQYIYWTKSTYKSTYSAQTHVVQGSTVLINSDIYFIYMYYNCSYVESTILLFLPITSLCSLLLCPSFSVFFWLYIYFFSFLNNDFSRY